MKDYIKDCYSDLPCLGYDTIRGWVMEAWEALPDTFLGELINSMLYRIQAVIDTNGIHTKF
jgi:hypothetical protein